MPPKAPPKPCGVEFPEDSEGKRPTTEINRETFAVAIEAIRPDLAEKVRAEKKWRFKYTKHVVDQVEASLQTPEAALDVAKAGLQYLHYTMEFLRDDKPYSINEAMSKFTTGTFQTGVVQGTAEPRNEAYIPYKGGVLRGTALKTQVDKWVRAGVIELSCGQALCQIADNRKWLDLSDQVFVMLGASSAMGPFPLLMALGATVVAVDIDRPHIWKKLFAICKASPGKLVFPLKQSQDTYASEDELAAGAGCNLLTETPEIRNWLLSVESGQDMTVGAYAYLDGPLFVRISVAMDAIISDLVDKRKAGVAYLCTPTDAHVVPAPAMAHSSEILRRSPLWQALLAMCLKGPQAMRPNKRKPVTAENGDEFYVCDAIVPDQGPNYILAKRLQHWRVMITRSKGCVASSNIAPSTATASVVSNKSFALAYQGMPQFKPIEVFQEETSSAVMGLLLVHDVRNVNSAANPNTELRNPLEVFTDSSFHGGAWRCGYKFGCIGVGSVLSALFTKYVLRTYLALYNGAQVAGWSRALFDIAMYASAPTSNNLWDVAGPTIGFFQWLAVLEVVHSLLGMVKSPVGTTAMQIWSRVMLVSAINYVPAVQGSDNKFLWAMTVAWCITEIIRYSYYGLGLYKINVGLLTWLRYTLFIVLYPTGVAGEMGCLYKSMPGMMDAPPSGANPIVSYFLRPILKNSLGYFLAIVPMYVVGLTTLYGHMLAQRKKVLGGGGGKKVKKE
jgi:hypothetical protein